MREFKWAKRLIFIVIPIIIGIVFTQLGTASTVYNLTKAQQLQELGILKGSNKGLELEKSLSRLDGSVMLVRLLGDEQLALREKYMHPFVDVPAWGNDYIGYLYEKGLTKGISSTKFGSQDLMTASQYATFVLRALGYEDSKGDFIWNKAVEKLVEIKSLPQLDANRSLTRDFLRDDMVAFSHYALNTLLKGSQDTLLDKLVEKGAVPTETKLLTSNSFNIQGIAIGDAVSDLITKRGKPDRIDASQYDFEWYIYNKDYKQFLQVGVKDSRIVALHSNILPWNGKGLDHQANRVIVHEKLGDPLDGIIIGNTKYTETANDRDVYLINNQYYLYLYYDLFDGDKVESIYMLDKQSRESLEGFYSSGGSEVVRAFELQVLDIVNATRVKRGLPVFKWSEQAAIVARSHSSDMAAKGYFNHVNIAGQLFSDRMIDGGIDFVTAAENIAAGGEDAFRTHVQWMNSEGHRKNMLAKQTYLGVGVSFGGEYKIYYTQNFYTP
jgi:uncharacterized protein YkwD